MKTLSVLIIINSVFYLYFSTPSLAKERHFELENTQFISMTNELTEREHEIIVWLPPGYQTDTDKQYPVLYFLDAYWDMPLLHSIHGQLTWDNAIPDLIMIGFSYKVTESIGDFRMRDFSPTSQNIHPNSGDGPKFLSFIKDQVIPKVETDFKINPNQRALAGSSFGGLFTLYAMYADPELFQRYISISPYASFDDNIIEKLDSKYSKLRSDLPARLFLSVGGAEYLTFSDPIRKYQTILQNRKYKGLSLLNYEMEGERHAGVKSEGYSRGLRWVFSDITPDKPSGLQQAYEGN